MGGVVECQEIKLRSVIARRYSDVAIYNEIATQFESTQIYRNDVDGKGWMEKDS
ncbi:MAG: hypothetical protein RBS77_05360 [Candidatus Moranbacteria bacterium]|jgi:hypothetical protein|nr:hypothetical protein [Candidatus Moranbacteria bacterium]